MKTLTLVGTRPDLIKLSETIKKLDQYTNHVFVHTGQNHDYELGEIFYNDLGLRKPDYFLGVTGDSLGETLGSIFKETERVLLKEKPDAVIILGDTNSALAGIIVKRMKIPLFHLEAGNRCFDDNVPEEINRRIIDHISDVNLAYTETARRYLLAEGIAKDRTFITGSPMKEILSKHILKIHRSDILDQFDLLTPHSTEGYLVAKPYYLVSLHRDENTEIQENFDVLVDTLSEIGYKYGLPVIVSTHPRLRKKLATEVINDNVQFHKPFGFLDYCKLQVNARCVISDSGTIAEESAILGFPAVTIRNAMERPEAIDAGSIILTGIDQENILKCIGIAKKPTTIPEEYGTNDFSDRVLKIVLGFTPYVNKYVWSKR